jgi:nicotinate-nucleotide--dimethylbenzimidazole phosphoribosyltransferase
VVDQPADSALAASHRLRLQRHSKLAEDHDLLHAARPGDPRTQPTGVSITGPTLRFGIAPLSRHIQVAVQQKIDQKTKPRGALGRLETLALQICLIQGTPAPQLREPSILLFAADHGAAVEGISAYPQDVTWQMVQNFLNGGAAINVFARQNGMSVTIVDAGVKHDFAADSRLHSAKIAHGTANYLCTPAMSTTQCVSAIARGAQLVRECAARGSNVLGFGEMGIGNTASASLLLHRIGKVSLEDCVGRGTGLDDVGLEHKRSVLSAATRRCPQDLSALDTLIQYGGFEIAMMVGGFLAAAESRMTILVDGFIASSAVLVAARMDQAVLDYCVFAHTSAEPGHRILLELLDARPLLDLNMRLGEGTGAAICYPILQAAVNFINEMASFTDAGIADESER